MASLISDDENCFPGPVNSRVFPGEFSIMRTWSGTDNSRSGVNGRKEFCEISPRTFPISLPEKSDSSPLVTGLSILPLGNAALIYLPCDIYNIYIIKVNVASVMFVSFYLPACFSPLCHPLFLAVRWFLPGPGAFQLSTTSYSSGPRPRQLLNRPKPSSAV